MQPHQHTSAHTFTESWFSKQFSRKYWHLVKIIGGSYFAKLSVFMPFIGYLIIFNAQIAQWLDLTPQLNAMPISPMYRLYSLYFGMLLSGIASFLFLYACPNCIKHYSGLADFVRKQIDCMDTFAAGSLKNDIIELSAKQGRQFMIARAQDLHQKFINAETNAYRLSGANGITDIVQHVQMTRQDCYRELAVAYWTLQNRSNRRSRKAVFVLYIAGFLFVSIPSVAVMWEIAGHVLTDLQNVFFSFGERSA